MFTGLNRVRKRISVFYAPCPSAIKSDIIGLFIYLFNFVDDIGLHRREKRVFGIIPYLITLSFSLYRI